MIVYAENDNLKELTREGFCIVDFYSDSCGPCKILAAILNRVEILFPFITVVKVNTSAYPVYSDEYRIDAVPTLLFINEGELCERHVGVLTEEQLKEKIALYMYG